MARTKRSEDTPIARRGNRNGIGRDPVHAHDTTLYRNADDGRYYTREHGGAAMQVDTHPHYLSRADAIDWIATEARDPVTDLGYTRDQAEKMADGVDAGKGYRSVDRDAD